MSQIKSQKKRNITNEKARQANASQKSTLRTACKKVAKASIGSEATPFSGTFEGNNIPVLNLTVNSSLEDMGFFGYCDSDSNIKDVILSKYTLNCVGYSKTVKNIDDLYTIAVDNAMTKNTVFEKADLNYFYF